MNRSKTHQKRTVPKLCEYMRLLIISFNKDSMPTFASCLIYESESKGYLQKFVGLLESQLTHPRWVQQIGLYESEDDIDLQHGAIEVWAFYMPMVKKGSLPRYTSNIVWELNKPNMTLRQWLQQRFSNCRT